MLFERIFNRKKLITEPKEKSILEMSDAEYAVYRKDKCDKKTEELVERLLSSGNYLSLGKYVNKDNHNFYILTSAAEHIEKILYAVNSESISDFGTNRLRKYEVPFISYGVNTDPYNNTSIQIQEFHTDIGISWEGLKNKGYGRPLIEKVIELATNKYNASKITGMLGDIGCIDSNGRFKEDFMKYRNDFYTNRGFTVICDESGKGNIIMDLVKRGGRNIELFKNWSAEDIYKFRYRLKKCNPILPMTDEKLMKEVEMLKKCYGDKCNEWDVLYKQEEFHKEMLIEELKWYEMGCPITYPPENIDILFRYGSKNDIEKRRSSEP